MDYAIKNSMEITQTHKSCHERGCLERASDGMIDALRGRVFGAEYVKVEKVDGEFVFKHVERVSLLDNIGSRIDSIKNPAIKTVATIAGGIAMFVLSYFFVPPLVIYGLLLKGADGLKWIALKLDDEAAKLDLVCKKGLEFKKEFDLAEKTMRQSTEETITTPSQNQRLVQLQDELRLFARGAGVSNPYPIEGKTKEEVDAIVSKYSTFVLDHAPNEDAIEESCF